MTVRNPFAAMILSAVFAFCAAAILCPDSSAADYAANNRSAVLSPDQAVAAAINNITVSKNGLLLQQPMHKAEFLPEGLAFTPKRGGPNWEWSLSKAAAKGNSVLDCVQLGQVAPQHQSKAEVSYHRGCIIEKYIAKKESVEQQFVIPEQLPLAGKDLVIEGTVKSPGEFETTSRGWAWRDRQGVVSLGSVYAFDAHGKKIPAAMSASAGSTRIVVDGAALDKAAYPVTIDPEVGTNDMRISDMGTDGDTSIDTEYTAIAYNSTNNEYLVVWEGEELNGEYEIYGQRINAETGAEVGTNDFRISDAGGIGDTEYDAGDPDVAYNSTNNEYLVVWSGEDNIAPLVNNEMEIFGQRLNAETGAEVGANDFRISDMGPDGQTSYHSRNPAIAYNATDNEYLVVWRGLDSPSLWEIYGQRLNAETGAEIGTNDFRISDMGADDNDTSFSAYEPDVVHNSTNNEYLVVWQGEDDTGSLVDGEYEIFGQRLNAETGAEVGTNDFRISDMGNTDGDTSFRGDEPAVAYNSFDNEYLVVWSGDDERGSLVENADEVFGQRLNAETGAEVGDNDFRISDMGPDGDVSHAAHTPHVAYDSLNNEYLVVWYGDDVASDEEVFGQLIDASTGAEIGTNDFALSDMGPAGDTKFSLEYPGVAYNTANKEYLVSWSGEDDTPPQVNGEYEVFIQRYAPPLKTDTDGDGRPDVTDTDDDNDGLSDIDEDTAGTDPLDSDSDDDSVTDGQETIDGSDPLDRGSFLAVLGTTLCYEWNGFLGGMWNIAEHVNLSGADMEVESTIKDIGGDAQSVSNFGVLNGAQTDLLVHDMTGWQLNSYGQVCSMVVGGSPGDLDGRMVYYKQDDTGAANDFQFAFAMPFQNGIMGEQYVTFNTYQPSLDAADAGNLVTNWIQLTNLESTAQSGALTFYGQNGAVLGTQSVNLEAGARQDFSGHQFGSSLVGHIKWVPDSSTAKFSLRNVRYFYDNASAIESFDGAYQLEGMAGSGELLAVPLDTTSGSSILEVVNTTGSKEDIVVRIYDAGGNVLDTLSFSLKANSSVHIVTDSILATAQGMATIQGASSGSIIAVMMQYERNASLGIDFLYGIPARQALGTTLRGSYNTFLNQGCRLILINPTGSDTTATVSMVRYDGTNVLAGEVVNIPAFGATDYDLCTNDAANTYGVVTVAPAATNTTIATVIRVGNGNRYRFPTPVRQ